MATACSPNRSGLGWTRLSFSFPLLQWFGLAVDPPRLPMATAFFPHRSGLGWTRLSLPSPPPA
eukprot:9586538-Prorocentrum_lima.AAC.1